jgi:hypothetical protein
MSDQLNNLFKSADDVQHYFRALGGANQYPGFMNWHIPAFVILLHMNKPNSKLLPEGIWRGTDNIQNKTRSQLMDNPPEPQDIAEFIAVTNKQVMKFKDPRESSNWNSFCELLKERTRG